MSKTIEIVRSGCRVVFTPESGGVPACISVKEFDRECVIAPKGFVLSMETAKFGRIQPGPSAHGPEHYFQNDAEVVEFPKLGWVDPDGKPVPDFELGLRYEFFPDGTVFCTAILHVETAHPPVCRNFTLSFPFDFSSFDDCRFAVYPRFGSGGAVDIQRIAAQRFVPAGKDIAYEGNLPIEYSFNLFREAGPSLYAEVFLESGAVLDGDNDQGSGNVRWEGKSPVAEWNFQTTDTAKDHRPLQWRNRWGWRIVPPETRRKLPPQHCYQFIDNYRHYPTADELETIARSGCTMLIVHSNWRRDAANGSIPYDPDKFRMVRETAKKYGISLLLYIRGSEKEIVEGSGEWFPRLLDKSRDGLYMDYAGPMSQMAPPEEFACGGTVLYYRHYRNLKRLREHLGENGLLIGHTGAWFSNVGMSFCDAYISGEGERGKLLAGRREFEYFTMAAAAPGSLWSAAFPEYATTAMIPFIASAGQFPHSPLGMQFASSSLLHPPEPGINDAVFRPLWRIWKLFASERNVAVFSDYNCAGIFGGTKGIGHYLMISADGRRALLILSDFGGKGEVAVTWEKTGFDPRNKNCYRLTPDELSPGKAVKTEKIRADFAVYPAEAYYFAPDGAGLAEFEAGYPDCGPSGKAFLEEIEQQRQWRRPAPTAKAELRLYLDDHLCTALEDSMVVDLYDEDVTLGVIGPEGFRALGIITPEGMVPPDRKDAPRILPGTTTAPVDLAALLGKGRHRLAVKSFYRHEPFYNFVMVKLTTDQGERTLEFRNQLETDRSEITWELTVK